MKNKNQIKISCDCQEFQSCHLCAVVEQTENDVEKDIIEFLDKLPRCKATKTSTTGRKKGKTWIKAQKSERKGKADLTVCYQGKYIEIEVKKPGGVQSDDQKKQEQETIAAGGVYWLVDNLGDVIKSIRGFNK
jgi:hypothetical protein